jgi:hypothetical protein
MAITIKGLSYIQKSARQFQQTGTVDGLVANKIVLYYDKAITIVPAASYFFNRSELEQADQLWENIVTKVGNRMIQELDARNQELDARNQELDAKKQELVAKKQELVAKNQQIKKENQEIDALNALLASLRKAL